ncbi:MAG: helix-turn-helix domain-containing protein, partial [Nocardioidaceae bacterium]
GAGLAELVRRYRVPVWSLPPATSTVQRVLQYPVCLLVISDSYAIMVGPDTGLGRQELAGEGWALGVMLQPAAGAMLLGGPVSRLADERMALDDVPTLDGSALTDRVRAALENAPTEPTAHRAAIVVLEAALDEVGTADDEGILVNRIVEYVEERPEVQRVGQVCEHFDIGERTLQRLTARRIGLSPKWLIQRRRLHDAAERLRSGDSVDLASVAMELGYADQAHFTRDFRTVTGLTPGGFAREPH